MSTVFELRLNPFSERILEDQVRIVQCGRPSCDVESFFRDSEKGSELKEVISRSDWITTCPVREGLFCWPCILFSGSGSEWNLLGFSNLSALSEVHEHETSEEHIEAAFQLRMFSIRNVIKPLGLELPVNAPQQSQNWKQQRDGLKVLIDTVINMHIVQERASFLNDSYDGLVNVEDTVTFLESLLKYSCDTQGIEDALELISHPPTFVHYLVDAMTRVIKSVIRTHLETTSNVSIILSEHSRTSERALLSTILRYIKDGEVYDGFVGFTSVANDRKMDDVYNHVDNLVNEFAITDQFLAYSLDGGVLPVSELAAFSEKMKAEYENVFFLPWHSHSIESDLLQGLSCIQDCKEFCHSMNSVEYFFHKNSKRLTHFIDVITPEKFALFVKKHIVMATYSFRDEMLRYFNNILKFPYGWNPDDVSGASGMCFYLTKFRTLFLLSLFHTVFSYFSQFVELMQSSNPELVFVLSSLKYLKEHLDYFRAAGFSKFWPSVQAEYNITATDKDKDEYRSIFDEILENVVDHVHVRFQDFKTLEFTHLFRPDPPDLDFLSTLDACLADVSQVCERIDADELRCEISALEVDVQVLEVDSEDDDPLRALYKSLVRYDSKSVLPNLFQLVDMCYSLPIRKAREDGEQKFQLVKKWCHYKNSTIQYGDKAVLAVEMDLVKELKERGTFYDDVISAIDVHD